MIPWATLDYAGLGYDMVQDTKAARSIEVGIPEKHSAQGTRRRELRAAGCGLREPLYRRVLVATSIVATTIPADGEFKAEYPNA
jgi:hypothetical protein